ncbi:uncharacterized protein V1513DRAFT_446395 [Lipomyces chichibuensis]|uniref:uncharacterized protein n=1 Tax=Lipomyces chichibuensis TaxID=1546026 RepID=UPI00334393A6
MSLSGKSIIITGGAKNLGALTAFELAALGSPSFTLHYHSNSDRDKAEAVAKDLREKYGSEVIIFQGALENPKEVEALFAAAKSAHGKVDIAINNVGMVLKKPFLEITEKEYDVMFNANSKSAFFFIQQAGKDLADGGKIVTIVTSLLAAFTGYYSVYAGSKSPVEHFCRAAAKEFGSRGISVNNIAPGPMDTPFFYGQETSESIEYNKNASMNGKLTDIKDIAPIVKFLVTEGWWINGQTIFANGAYTTR